MSNITPQQIERVPARACAYLSTISDSELAQGIDCIEGNSTTTSLVHPQQAQQQLVSVAVAESSTPIGADAPSRGINIVAQKREAVLAAMNDHGDGAHSAPNAPPTSQDNGLGSAPIQADQQQQGAMSP